LTELEIERHGGSLTTAQLREARSVVLGAELDELLQAVQTRLIDALTRRWAGEPEPETREPRSSNRR
jgi:hypothetical protein